MAWYSDNELKDMRKRDLENQLRDLEREYDWSYDKLKNPGKYDDVNSLERTCARILDKISDIKNEIRGY